MGIEPVSATIYLGIVTVGAFGLFLQECERQREERRSNEEYGRRLHREAKEREKEARRREREREEQEKREEEEEKEERRRRNALSDTISNYDYDYRMKSTSVYYPEEPYGYRFEIEPLFSSQGENGNCSRGLCNTQQARFRTENSFNSNLCGYENFNPFENRKNSIRLTIIPPQTTQNKNPNAKTQGSNNRSSSNSQSTTSKSSGNASKQNTNSAQKGSSSGSQQAQQNNNNNHNYNNNNNNNNNNDNDKQETVQHYGKLNDFIKKLKTVLDRCNASAKLREKILSFFNKFEKHEDNFLRMLEDYQIQNIAVEDILSLVITLFQSDDFAKDVAYGNFIALMEIVAKYIADELLSEMAADRLRRNKISFEERREECMKKILNRNNNLTKITDLFKTTREKIVEDNANQPLEPDFLGTFTKVYHYLKHRDFRGKILTVTEYFDLIRKLLILLKGLNPEYVELTNVNHPRREIVLDVYSVTYRGCFRIVVRAYGPRINVCTYFLKGCQDKNAKDGDMYVDGKKKK